MEFSHCFFSFNTQLGLRLPESRSIPELRRDIGPIDALVRLAGISKAWSMMVHFAHDNAPCAYGRDVDQYGCARIGSGFRFVRGYLDGIGTADEALFRSLTNDRSLEA
jgi:hypothetical protein